MKIGERIETRIEKPVYGGDFLARHNGQVVFAPLVMPHEFVAMEILEAKRNYARGEAKTLIEPSPDRLRPECVHFGQCGGCHYQHAGSEQQRHFKLAILRDALSRAGLDVPQPILLLDGHPWAYRNRIRLAVDSTIANSGSRLGYRARFSHRIVPIVQCPIASPVLVPLALRIAEWLKQQGHLDCIAEIELITNPTQDAVQVTLIPSDANGAGVAATRRETQVAAQPVLRLASLLDTMLEEIGSPLSGITLATGDNDPASAQIAQVGSGTLLYSVAETQYEIPAGAFFQVNRWLLEPFRALVTQHEKGSLAWDLFAGVGFFARALEMQFDRVIAVEGANTSFRSLQNALKNPSSRAVEASTLSFLHQNRREREKRPDFLVLDPPRSGLGAETCALLAAIHPARMTYVSCDPVTLARDLKLLTAERFQIESIHLVDLFPQTYHIETVVKLVRKS